MKLTRLKSDRPRHKHDFYPTPYGLAYTALTRLKWDEGIGVDKNLPLEILDAGCGSGIWMDAANHVFDGHKVNVYGVDLEPKCDAFKEDFLKFQLEGVQNKVSLICGNPPYSLMEEFIRHSLESNLLEDNGRVFFLGRLEFLASKARCFGLFQMYPPKKVYVLSRRPSFFSVDGKHSTDAQDYAIYMWQKGYGNEYETMLDWMYWDYDKVRDIVTEIEKPNGLVVPEEDDEDEED